MRALDHRLLRQFLAVVEAGTVRAAARALHTSQPPLTAAIRQLEERLGVALFERSVWGMRPTAAGAALARDARAIIGHIERAEARVRAVGDRPPPLRIGFVSAALNGVLPALLRGLRAAGKPAPRLFELTTPEQLDALSAGRIDVGLLHPPVPELPGIAGVALGRDPFWAALPADHALTRRAKLTFADIAAEPFVLFPQAQGPVLYDRIRALALAAGGAFHVAAEARRAHSQLAIVAGGLGVGLITRSTAAALRFRGVRAIPLTDTEHTLYLELRLLAAADVLAALPDPLAAA